MNWKEEAVDKLRKYGAMRLACQNIPEELRRLEIAAQSIRSAGTDSPHVRQSGTGQEERILSNIVQRQELCWALDNAKSWVRTTDRALSALNPEEKLVLHRLFIAPEKGAVDRLCEELGGEQSSAYRRRDRSLRSFTLALYGNLES